MHKQRVLKKLGKRTERTIIARNFAPWAAPFVSNATDATYVLFAVVSLIVSCIPAPMGDCVPAFDSHFH